MILLLFSREKRYLLLHVLYHLRALFIVTVLLAQKYEKKGYFRFSKIRCWKTLTSQEVNRPGPVKISFKLSLFLHWQCDRVYNLIVLWSFPNTSFQLYLSVAVWFVVDWIFQFSFTFSSPSPPPVPLFYCYFPPPPKKKISV